MTVGLMSPGIEVREIDLTTIIPSVSSTEGALAGVFKWGPVQVPTLITSEVDLVKVFGKPKLNWNTETFFTAADYLSYTDALYISRACDGATSFGQTSNEIIYELELPSVVGVAVGQVILHDTTGASGRVTAVDTALKVITVSSYSDNFITGACVINGVNNTIDAVVSKSPVQNVTVFNAIYPGEMGNSIEVHVMDSNGFYMKNPNVTLQLDSVVGYNIGDIIEQQLVGTTPSGSIVAIDAINKLIEISPTTSGFQKIDARFVHKSSLNVILGDFVPLALGQSDYTVYLDNAPSLGDYHVVVVDAGGLFTGVPGAVLEVFPNLSTEKTAKTDDGSSLYFITAINRGSQYIRIPETLDNLAGWPNFLTGYESIRLGNGTDGNGEEDISMSELQDAWYVFQSAEEIDISIVLQGKSRKAIATQAGNETYLGNWLIDQIAHVRKDVIVCISPHKDAVVNNKGRELQDVSVFKTGMYPGSNAGVDVGITSSSYAVVDSGYKYRYDRYNDTYVWVPLNGDIGGILARTDDDRDPWWSPAGYNRGILKNVVKLAYNPVKTSERDQLYKMGVNPVFTQVGVGTLMFGDKTALVKPSAFDRINVRRLFIVLEKAIAKASRYFLFEFNDAFTRAQFINMVEPYLRDIQGRRGIYDFRVVCDETNNTPEVIDRNEFIGDIYIKPARSINFIQLNFIAVRTGVEFSEIVGKAG